MRAKKIKHPILTILLLIGSQLTYAGTIPFTSDDLNLESAINSNAIVLDVLNNDDSGISGNNFKEVIALCDISSTDQDCTSNSFSTATGSVSINGSGDNNNVIFTSNGSSSSIFQFKYVMQNGVFATGAADAQVALTYFAVNTLTDSGTGGCDAAECSLREAIVSSESDGESSEIRFDRDLTGTIVLATQLDIDSIDLAIIGPGPDKVTVSGNGTTQIFDVSAMAERFTLSGLTLTQGYSSNLNADAIHIENALDVKLDNLRVTENEGDGGIAVINSSVTLSNTEISNNESVSNAGGIKINGGFGNDVILENVTFSNNTAQSGFDNIFIGAGNGQTVTLKYVTVYSDFANTDATPTTYLSGNGMINIESSIFTGAQEDIEINTDDHTINNSIINTYTSSNPSGMITGNNNLLNTDPQLLPMAYIGSSNTQVHGFDPSSPAKDHVDSGIGISGCGDPNTTDQIGTPRPVDLDCDAGAYEYIFIDEIFINGFEQ